MVGNLTEILDKITILFSFFNEKINKNIITHLNLMNFDDKKLINS